MFKAEENLDDLKYKGKPFYWVDEKRLKMLKKVFETQEDEAIRQKAKDALLQYKKYVDKFNQRSKGKQIKDIYTAEFQSPYYQEPLPIPSFSKNLSMDKEYKKCLNISVQNDSTLKGTETMRT